jgi:zinc/manganese transport system substrate-binding protein
MILAVRKADILMYNGLDLEIGYLPVLIESSRNPKVQHGQPGNFDSSHFVTVVEKPISVDRSMGDVHPLGNPHYHYSPARNFLWRRGCQRPVIDRSVPCRFVQGQLAHSGKGPGEAEGVELPST